MRMASYLDRALRKFGNTVHICRDGRTEVSKAFVQPLRRRHRLYINDRYIPAGYFDNRYLLYIGPGDKPLKDNMRIVCNGTAYTVVTAESFAAHDEDIYVWAILMPVCRSKEDYYDLIDREQD
ncbi:hypothetical protein [Ruminococcus sp.]|uniref:hypothetical protein n=1 Tax=Ruminococcus sp. TaxID=41978 RepID=UPI003865A408|nr:hypothetical protein [Ruminococcus sp.]